VVKVNPDAPQRGVRFRALKQGKLLRMPTPRLREGFLLLDPARIPDNRLFAASSISGAFSLARQVGLDELPTIDLLVFGSVAVTAEGDRVGKGEGYAELEFAVLRTLDRVPADIVIATTVHDEQLVESIPREAFDVSLDLICTPTHTLRVGRRPRRPGGVLWDKLPDERRREMPILEELYQRRSIA
jgi:5-formyltetrahydrofolate cyclo-ligase